MNNQQVTMMTMMPAAQAHKSIQELRPKLMMTQPQMPVDYGMTSMHIPMTTLSPMSTEESSSSQLEWPKNQSQQLQNGMKKEKQITTMSLETDQIQKPWKDLNQKEESSGENEEVNTMAMYLSLWNQSHPDQSNDTTFGMTNIDPKTTTTTSQTTTLYGRIDDYELYVDEDVDVGAVAHIDDSSVEGEVVSKKRRREWQWEDYEERDDSYRREVKRVKEVEEGVERKIAKEMRKDIKMIRGRRFDKALAYSWGKKILTRSITAIAATEALGQYWKGVALRTYLLYQGYEEELDEVDNISARQVRRLKLKELKSTKDRLRIIYELRSREATEITSE